MQRQGLATILLGPPGAGKGTQAAHLSSSHGIPVISTGEILRRECQSGSALGLQVQDQIDHGQLIQDELMLQVLTQRLGESDCESGFILDGFPRTARQARFLDRLLATLGFGSPLVFDLKIAADDLIARLSIRRQCPICARTYPVKSDSNTANCPQDGAILTHRADDNLATIGKRLQIYEQNIEEIRSFYAKRNYFLLNGAQPSNVLFSELDGLFRSYRHGTKDYILLVPNSHGLYA